MKKILFLFLIIFITDSFATITCERKVIRNSPVDSFSCAQLEQRSGVPEPTTCRTTNVNYHYYVSNKTSILQYEYDGLTCPNSPIYPNVANDSFCYSNDGDNVTCINSLENGSFDDDGIRCNSGHSLTGMGAGIPACMPNPDNGSLDDNDDLVCNHNYHKNEDGSGCVLDDGWNDIPIDVDTGTSNGDGGIGGTGDTGSGSTGSTDSGSGTGGTSGGSTDSGSGTGGTSGGSTGGTGTSGGSTGGTGTSGGSTGGTGTSGGGTDGNGTDLGGVISAINKNTSENTKALEKLNDSLNSKDSTLTDDLSSKYSKNDSDFLNFYNDMKSSYDNFNSQFDTAKGIFEGGFNFTPIFAVNNPNLKECLTIKVFGNHEVVMDFITPLYYIKPIFSLIIQLFMLVEVVRVCFKIVNYARGLF